MNNIDTANRVPHIKLPPLLKGIIGAAITATVGTALLAAAFCFSAMPSDTMHAMQLPLLALSAFIGAFIAAKSAGRKGLQQGFRLAVALLIIMAVFTLIGGSFSPIALVLKGVIVLIAAALGGISGVF